MHARQLTGGWQLFRLFILAALPFIVSSTTSYAQEKASINGYVRDAKNGETLLLVNVILDGTNKGVATNTAGYYSLTNIEPGTWTIRVTYLGFRTFRREVTLAPGQNLRLDINLEPDALLLGEVVVEDEVYKEESRNVGVTQIQVNLIKELPAVLEADVFRSIQLMPGSIRLLKWTLHSRWWSRSNTHPPRPHHCL
jgi:hypothetical protein